MSDAVIVAAIAAGASILTAAISTWNSRTARAALNVAHEVRHHVAENGHKTASSPTVPDRIGTLQDLVVRLDGRVEQMHAESRAKWAEVDARFSLMESRRLPRRWF